jgi:hypothetical protein
MVLGIVNPRSVERERKEERKRLFFEAGSRGTLTTFHGGSLVRF